MHPMGYIRAGGFFLFCSRASAFEILVFSKFQKIGGIRNGIQLRTGKSKIWPWMVTPSERIHRCRYEWSGDTEDLWIRLVLLLPQPRLWTQGDTNAATGNWQPGRCASVCIVSENETLSVSFDESAFPDRYAWVDTLEDLRLLQAIKTLSIEELEILTFLTLEEHSQKELAERWGCSQRAISKKFQKIKKFFQKWF